MLMLCLVLPASAGMIPMGMKKIGMSDCAPRIRGDDPLLCDIADLQDGCSPHPRG